MDFPNNWQPISREELPMNRCNVCLLPIEKDDPKSPWTHVSPHDAMRCPSKEGPKPVEAPQDHHPHFDRKFGSKGKVRDMSETHEFIGNDAGFWCFYEYLGCKQCGLDRSDKLHQPPPSKPVAPQEIDPAVKLLADVMHLWVDGYICKAPNSLAPSSIASHVFNEIESLLATHRITVDYSGWAMEPKPAPRDEQTFEEWWDEFREKLPKTTELLRMASFCQIAEAAWNAAKPTPTQIEAMPKPLDVVNRIRVMGGYFGFTEQQTDDLAEDLEEWLAKKIEEKAPQEPACPMTVGNWTVEEWKAAEARVFAKRVLYNPDSLSAIYKDIAINLQAELTRNASIIVAKGKALTDLIIWLPAIYYEIGMFRADYRRVNKNDLKM